MTTSDDSDVPGLFEEPQKRKKEPRPWPKTAASSDDSDAPVPIDPYEIPEEPRNRKKGKKRKSSPLGVPYRRAPTARAGSTSTRRQSTRRKPPPRALHLTPGSSSSDDDSDDQASLDPFEIPKEPRKKKIVTFRSKAFRARRSTATDVLPSNHGELEAMFERVQQHELKTCTYFDIVRGSSVSHKTPPPRDRDPATQETESMPESVEQAPESDISGADSGSLASSRVRFKLSDGSVVSSDDDFEVGTAFKKQDNKTPPRLSYKSGSLRITDAPGTDGSLQSNSRFSLSQIEELSSGDKSRYSTSRSSSSLTRGDVLMKRRERIERSQSLLEDCRRREGQTTAHDTVGTVKKTSSLPSRRSLAGQTDVGAAGLQYIYRF